MTSSQTWLRHSPFTAAALWLAATALWLAAAACGAQSVPADVPASAQHAFHEGQSYETQLAFPAAADSFRSAAKLAGPGCLSCLTSLERVQVKLGAYPDAIATAAQLARVSAPGAPHAAAELLQAQATMLLSYAQAVGEGGIDKNQKKADASMKQAEALLHQAETDDPASEPVRMLRGHVLAAMKRDDDAKAEFAACAASGASPEECARAHRFAQDVSLARGVPAPGFTATTMDGAKVSLDSLAGKVVLIDFWATWCTFCRRDSDYVQSMLDSFDGKPFVLLEVDVDESQDKWRNYVQQERLKGTQTWDQASVLRDAFHVSAYPTYIILDENGIVQMRVAGARGDLRGTLRQLLDHGPAKPAAAAPTATPVGPPAGSSSPSTGR